MEQIQKATLTLKTIDIPLNGVSSYGSSDEYRTNMTWNNINFRLLLGDMYDKYDLFNLQLVSIGSDDDRVYDSVNKTYSFVAGVDPSDRNVTINLSGLNLINNTYDSFNNQIGISVVIGTYQFYQSFAKEYTNSIVTFTKGNDMANINIMYKTIVDNQKPLSVTNYPHMVFMFNIYGIPKDKTK